MKYKVTTKDPKEAKRLAKATDMAFFIFELVCNSRSLLDRQLTRKAEEDALDLFYEHINYLLEKYSIDINDLTE